MDKHKCSELKYLAALLKLLLMNWDHKVVGVNTFSSTFSNLCLVSIRVSFSSIWKQILECPNKEKKYIGGTEMHYCYNGM